MEKMKNMTDVVSTGLAGLDQAIGGLAPGENVVWQINDLADYIYVANRFVMHVARSGQRIVYFRFGEHQEIMDAEAMARGGVKLMFIELGMPSNHLIFCCPLLHLLPIPPSISLFQ